MTWIGQDWFVFASPYTAGRQVCRMVDEGLSGLIVLMINPYQLYQPSSTMIKNWRREV